MIEFLCGIIGAVMLIGSFVLGADFGRKTAAKPEPAPLSDAEKAAQMAERQRLIDEQSAFDRLMGYNVSQAYGIGVSKEIENAKEERRK